MTCVIDETSTGAFPISAAKLYPGKMIPSFRLKLDMRFNLIN